MVALVPLQNITVTTKGIQIKMIYYYYFIIINNKSLVRYSQICVGDVDID